MTEEFLKQLSQTGDALRARLKRINANIKKQEAAMFAEVQAFVDCGMNFDEAWIASGGIIIDCTPADLTQNARDAA